MFKKKLITMEQFYKEFKVDITSTNLGMQLEEDLSLSQLPNKFIGTVDMLCDDCLLVISYFLYLSVSTAKLHYKQNCYLR